MNSFVQTSDKFAFAFIKFTLKRLQNVGTWTLKRGTMEDSTTCCGEARTRPYRN